MLLWPSERDKVPIKGINQNAVKDRNWSQILRELSSDRDVFDLAIFLENYDLGVRIL